MIRFANEYDLPIVNEVRQQVHELHAQGRPDIFRKKFGKELANYIHDIFDDEDTDIAVADIDGKICGYAVIEIVDKPKSPYSKHRKFLKVEEFGVDKDCRRQGIGTQLFEFIRQVAAERNIDTIEIDVWEFNESTLKFYESLGFKTYRRYMEFKR